jgi:ubiquinone/menaquinone biosynthesis C-methylase UbiE
MFQKLLHPYHCMGYLSFFTGPVKFRQSLVQWADLLSRTIMEDTRHIIETFTELAPRYEAVVDSELSRFWGWSYTGFVNQLVQMTPIPEKVKMLDLATGTGVIPLLVIGKHLNNNPVHGLDITRSMLRRAREKACAAHVQDRLPLVCASAMEIPYADASFDMVTCALATHHMDVSRLLAETQRVLAEGGMLSMADVGGSSLWRTPVVRTLLKAAAFVYFLFKENLNRAWAEADAVSNVRSPEEWHVSLEQAGFRDIRITRLKSKHRWIPEPLVIQAIKRNQGATT